MRSNFWIIIMLAPWKREIGAAPITFKVHTKGVVCREGTPLRISFTALHIIYGDGTD
jgi:hypothetical protein